MLIPHPKEEKNQFKIFVTKYLFKLINVIERIFSVIDKNVVTAI